MSQPSSASLVALAVVVGIGVAVGNYIFEAYQTRQAVDAHNAAMRSLERTTQAALRESANRDRRLRDAEDRRQRRSAESRRLKDGERCMAGKFIRSIPGGYEDDPTQDWKCRNR